MPVLELERGFIVIVRSAGCILQATAMSREATPFLYQVFGLCLLDSERQHRTRQGSSAVGGEIGFLFSLGTLCMLRTHSTCAKLHAQPWKQSLKAVCVKHLAQKQPLLTALSYRVRAMLAQKTADDRLQSRSGYKRRDLLSFSGRTRPGQVAADLDLSRQPPHPADEGRQAKTGWVCGAANKKEFLGKQ